MREIKFRAWDGENFLYPVSFIQSVRGKIFVAPNGYNIIQQNGAVAYIETEFVFEDFPVSQYTGLKDKNGKEIYESDILEHSQHGYTEKFEVCYGLGNYDSGVYKFIGFYLKKISNGDDDGYTGYMFDTNYIEVIGNIWQNPELFDNQEGK